MNFSLSVLLTLLFLAPGVAGYFGLTLSIRERSVRRPAPAPNSLNFLVLVLLCALLAHCAALTVFATQDLYCRTHPCLGLGFDPDAYATLARLLGSSHPEIRSATILYELLALVTLSVLSFRAAEAWSAWDLRRGDRSHVAALYYRWLGPYIRHIRARGGVINAYVLTKMRHEDMALGYRGIVSELNLGTDGEVTAITLFAVERFGLRLGATDSPDQRTLALSGLLGLVHIPGREIENVALTAFSLDDAESSAEAEVTGS